MVEILIRDLILKSDEEIQKVLDTFGLDDSFLAIGVQTKRGAVIKRVPQLVRAPAGLIDPNSFTFAYVAANRIYHSLIITYSQTSGWKLDCHDRYVNESETGVPVYSRGVWVPEKVI